MVEQKVIFSGSSHPSLTEELCKNLKIPMGKISIQTFPDKEISVEILENVQGKDVFVLQTLAPDPNTYLLELLIIVDALKRSFPRTITAIIPYLAYCRQDRRSRFQVPITAKLVANLLETSGVSRLIAFDFHTEQIEGFFDIPVIHLHSQDVFAAFLKTQKPKNYIIVAPDMGSIRIAERMSTALNTDLAIIKKERSKSGRIKTTLIGDVAMKNVLLIDDICSTGETLAAAARICLENRAEKIIAMATHALFTKNCLNTIQNNSISSLVVTNTTPTSIQSKNVLTLSVAPTLADAISKL